MAQILRKLELENGTVIINQDGTSVTFNGNHVNIKTMKGKGKSKGLYYCSLGGKQHYIHRLVGIAFVKNYNNEPFVTHIDTNTLNNHYKNLRWGNQKDIAQNMIVQGKFLNQPESRETSKISLNQLPNVIERIAKGDTNVSIAKAYGTSEMSIVRIKKRYPNRIKNVRKELSNMSIRN